MRGHGKGRDTRRQRSAAARAPHIPQAPRSPLRSRTRSLAARASPAAPLPRANRSGAQACAVVGYHGAGTINLLYACPGTLCLEVPRAPGRRGPAAHVGILREACQGALGRL